MGKALLIIVGGFSIIFTGVIFILLIGTVVYLTGFGRWAMERAGFVTPMPFPAAAALPSPTPVSSFLPAPTEEATAVISAATFAPSGTATQTRTTQPTLPPTETSTPTVTAEPTPILALIRASEGGGAFIREEPGGQVIATLGNGSTVTIIPNDLQEVNNVVWVHVSAQVNDRRVDGWMIQSVLQTATPVADWQPSPTQPATQTQ